MRGSRARNSGDFRSGTKFGPLPAARSLARRRCPGWSRLARREHQVRRFLADHNTGGIRLARDRGRHDRGVRDAEPGPAGVIGGGESRARRGAPDPGAQRAPTAAARRRLEPAPRPGADRLRADSAATLTAAAVRALGARAHTPACRTPAATCPFLASQATNSAIIQSSRRAMDNIPMDV
jgi:hypothetical protein